MTRETKIGLLAGLAFIIVIGILFTENYQSKGAGPQAALTDAGATERQAVDTPGRANPPISFVVPQEAPPRQSVPTHDELSSAPSPVIPSARSTVTSPPEDHGADMPIQDKALADVAQRNGESLIQANMDGTSKIPDAQPAAPAPVTTREYKAQPGDSVSRMAARFLGANSPANRQAIIDANPSLRDDPDTVLVGQSYVIPARAEAAATPPDSDSTAQPANPPTAQSVYVVQEGDSLWQIASDELGDPSEVDAIKELNADILKGKDHETVIPGMKLRLPAKPVAVTN
jgi:nucleoid-associated protein YgaU